jgi:hypothetical protein
VNNREDDYTFCFRPVNQEERVAFHEYSTSPCDVAETSHRKHKRARRRFLDCRPKPLGSAGLHAGVVLNFLEEFCFGFLEKPRLTHEPAMIVRAFAKTSSAGTSLASPRS